MVAKPTPAKPAAFRNRIVGHGDEAPDQILANPLNWRGHPHTQEQALEGVLEQVGWVQEVIVNKRTNTLIDGHLRVALALTRNEPTVPVKYVDLTDDEEKLVLATIDPIAGMAFTDAAKLDDLLKEVNSDSAAVQQMLSDLAEKNNIGSLPDSWKEYDESVANDVEYITCPHCGEKFPK